MSARPGPRGGRSAMVVPTAISLTRWARYPFGSLESGTSATSLRSPFLSKIGCVQQFNSSSRSYHHRSCRGALATALVPSEPLGNRARVKSYACSHAERRDAAGLGLLEDGDS